MLTEAYLKAVARRYSSQQVFLKILQISHENTCENALRPATLLKETPTQVFSSEIYEIFKNTARGCFCVFKTMLNIQGFSR